MRLASKLIGKLLHARTYWKTAGVDAALLSIAWLAAIVLRYDADVPAEAWPGWASLLPLWVGVAVVCTGATGLYSGVWRHASIYEARQILLAHGASVLVVVPIVILRDRPVPLSVPLVAAVLSVGLVGTIRFQPRLVGDGHRTGDDVVRFVVLGAGSAGVALAEDAQRHGERACVVAFLDDDPALQGRRIRGVRVEGAIDDLPLIVDRLRVSSAILAVPSAGPELVRRVAALAEGSGTVLRVLPRLSDLVDGRVQLSDVRDVEPSDLLGRGQIETDLDAVLSLVQGRRVLVTGAGGSIGSEIARQVARLGAERVALVDHDETHLFDAAAHLPATTAVQHLADIREEAAVRRVFEAERPHIVFHAAAHKHVPLLESHPVEAVQTNVLGTQTVVEAARTSGVEHFVFISTDKAVQPGNVMGATKSLGESIVLQHSGAMTSCVVRFGNVLGSRGSVVPTFVDQIRRGGPVTITDGRMTRYFMSIPEAVRLVVNAAAMADGGEIFLLDMGKPVHILDLAHRLIRLSGRRPGLDVEIRVTGVRPGEKLYEELHTPAELQRPTNHPSIMQLRPMPVPRARLDQLLEKLTAAVAERADDLSRRLLFDAVGAAQSSRIPAQKTPESAPAISRSDVAWI
ncbi:polysaccharide biosynthesis protein [Nocardioides mesophilus]|uniref:Polysaccharide biosynthesis protein n=1 Tax=Nocardioides mesophilus TaxID=433659 RepID=A0A7G9R996_9ACTN|nr:nucleoside-diphosphate sugar epimerase/dehydratase [Nocardioides mesophilus]QNN52171.1 polysaccharide biosynthesis protein [Nocardioides mesophilus]